MNEALDTVCIISPEGAECATGYDREAGERHANDLETRIDCGSSNDADTGGSAGGDARCVNCKAKDLGEVAVKVWSLGTNLESLD